MQPHLPPHPLPSNTAAFKKSLKLGDCLIKAFQKFEVREPWPSDMDICIVVKSPSLHLFKPNTKTNEETTLKKKNCKGRNSNNKHDKHFLRGIGYMFKEVILSKQFASLLKRGLL